MKIADILQVESDNKNCIHIIRDRLFWTVYEMSAYYFVNNFKSYKVHSKFVQNVKRDIVWLGFPDSALSKIFQVLSPLMELEIQVENKCVTITH